MDTIEIDDFDYGELKNDTSFISKSQHLSECIEKVRQNLAIAREDYKNYESFTLEEKVKYDLHLAYSINSLYWMYHKIVGLDPNKHGIKDELARIKAAMVREKEVYDHKYNRPVLDQGAAKRFIRAGLYDAKAQAQQQQQPSGCPPNKKIRFED